MSSNKTALLIMGSTRAGRICPKITAWIAQLGRECTDLNYEIVDLADWSLPMDDEPALPALGPYVQEHTQAWSNKIKNADAVIFVTPQFNWGYPAVLKNAIDHLYREWHGKSTAIVTYGGHGGVRCAKQLRQVAASIKMRVVATAPAICLPDAVIRHGASFDPDHDFKSYRKLIQKALIELEAQVNDLESFFMRIRRKWKALVAVVI